MILFKFPLNTPKFCLRVLYSIEFGAHCLNVMYKLFLDLIERNIRYDIQFIFLRIFLAYVNLSVISDDNAVCYFFRLDQLVSLELNFLLYLSLAYHLLSFPLLQYH